VQSQCGYFGRKQNTDPALTDYILLAPFTKLYKLNRHNFFNARLRIILFSTTTLRQ